MVYISCIIPDSLNTNCGPGGRDPIFPRQVDKKCQEEACIFKGHATGKGLWVGFCSVQWQLSVGACCFHLSLQFQNTRRRKSVSALSIWRLTPPLHGLKSSRPAGIHINNENILSSCMPGHPAQQLGAIVWHFGNYTCSLSCPEFNQKTDTTIISIH